MRGSGCVSLPEPPVQPLFMGAVLLARTVLCTAIALWLAALVPALFGMTVSTVMSNSMAPSIVAGDVVIVRPIPAGEARLGQVLLVDDPDRPGRLRLHRLAAKHAGALVLRGDANSMRDSSVITAGHLRGAAILRVPLAGLPDLWLRTGALIPLMLFAGALIALGLLACADIRPAPQHEPRGRRPAARPRELRARLLPLGGRRVVGLRALVLLGALGAAAIGSGAGVQGGAVFSGIATSSTNTVGAASLFTNCPARPAGLPTPSISYAYTATTGTTETDLAGSNTGVLAAGPTRQAGYCDGSAPSPYLALTNGNAQTVVSAGSEIQTPPTAYSISLWVDPTSSGGILASFADSNDIGSEGVSDRRIYYRSDGTLAFGALHGGSVVYCSTAAPATGTWHNLVSTATAAGVLTLYVDGAQACSVTAGSGAASSAPGFWHFGADKSFAGWSEGPSTGLIGGLDETTVYTSAITDSDVTNLFAAGH